MNERLILFLAFFALFSFVSPNLVYKGMSFDAYSGIPFGTATSIQSLKNMADTGVKIFAMIPSWYVKTINDTQVHPVPPNSPTDEEVKTLLNEARKLGLKVMLKPHVDVQSGIWRANIGKYFTAQEWDAFFVSYTKFITHFAQIAQEYSDIVDIFSAGVEYVTPSKQSAQWRKIVGAIRDIYKGRVTYSANWGEEIDRIDWLDVLDIVGCDAYYPLTKSKTPSFQDLMNGWVETAAHLKNISKYWGKDMIFTEIGYKSVSGCAISPGNYKVNGALNETQQELCYEAVFQTFMDEEWWDGAFFWSWSSNAPDGGKCDGSYTPHDKLASNVLKKYYGASEKTKVVPVNVDSLKAETVVYQNGALGSQWSDSSWGGSVNLKDTQQKYGNDQYSAYANLNSWGALAFHASNFNTAGYSSLKFAFHGSSEFDGATVEFESSEHPLVKVNLNSYMSDCQIPTDKWVEISIKLGDIFGAAVNISRIDFRNDEKPAKFWVDQVIFE